MTVPSQSSQSISPPILFSLGVTRLKAWQRPSALSLSSFHPTSHRSQTLGAPVSRCVTWDPGFDTTSKQAEKKNLSTCRSEYFTEPPVDICRQTNRPHMCRESSSTKPIHRLKSRKLHSFSNYLVPPRGNFKVLEMASLG